MSETNGEIPHDLALYLLHHQPGYRELIRQRIHEEQKRRRKMDASVTFYREKWMKLRGIEPGTDVDLLTEKFGREIEGCG